MTGAREDNGKLFEWYQNALDEGEIHKESFYKGEECVLFLTPFYLMRYGVMDSDMYVVPVRQEEKQGNLGKIYRYFKEPGQIKVGDYVTVRYLNREKRVRVSGIVHHVKDTWNQDIRNLVSGSGQIAVSDQFITELAGEDAENRYNDIEISSRAGADHSVVDQDVEDTVDKFTFRLKDDDYMYNNIRESSERIMSQYLQKMVWSVFCGSTLLLIYILIIYQTSLGKIENDRERIGILRSIGISQKRLRRVFLRKFLAQGFFIGSLGIVLSFIIQIIQLKEKRGYVTVKGLAAALNASQTVPGELAGVYGLSGCLFVFIYMMTICIPIWKLVNSDIN